MEGKGQEIFMYVEDLSTGCFSSAVVANGLKSLVHKIAPRAAGVSPGQAEEVEQKKHTRGPEEGRYSDTLEVPGDSHS